MRTGAVVAEIHVGFFGFVTHHGPGREFFDGGTRVCPPRLADAWQIRPMGRTG